MKDGEPFVVEDFNFIEEQAEDGKQYRYDFAEVTEE